MEEFGVFLYVYRLLFMALPWTLPA